MESQTDTQVLYKEIKPALDLFENGRKEAAKNTMALRVMLGFTLITILCLLIFFVKNLGVFAIIITLILGQLFFYFSGHFKRKYLAKYKKDLIQLFFGQEGIKSTHESYEHIYSKYFKQSGIFRYSNHHEGEDLITGKKGGLYFLCSELEARYKRRRKNRSNINKEVFTGLYFSAQIPHDTKTSITIHCKDFRYPYSQKIVDKKFESLNQEFDENFRLDYEDYDQTSHILSPDFMERLIAFKKKHKYPFVIKINRNQVYMAIHENRDFFKVRFDSTASDPKMIQLIRDDCQFFFDTINVLQGID